MIICRETQNTTAKGVKLKNSTNLFIVKSQRRESVAAVPSLITADNNTATEARGGKALRR